MTVRAWSVVTLIGASASCGCAGRFDPADFEGSRESRRAEPEAIAELAAPTKALETLGIVHASCTLSPGFRRLHEEALSDLDCTTERLVWALRESAANAGGEVLIRTHCDSWETSHRDSHLLSCAAGVARFRRGNSLPGPLAAPRSLAQEMPAPSASDVKRINQPDASLGFRISLSFEPKVAKLERRERAGSEVSELSVLPIADLELGDLVATCNDGCDERALRYAVQIAAGRLGAPDVVGVRCFSTGSRQSCVGTLAAPTHDE